MKYILIVWLLTGGGSMTAGEFDTKERCEDAGKKYSDHVCKLK